MSDLTQDGAAGMAEQGTAGGMLGDGAVSSEQVAAELESLRKALKAANAESMTRRKRLEELEAAEEARKAAELSEIDKAQRAQAAAEARAQAAEERMRTATIRNAVVLAASKASFYDPEDAFRLADLGSVEIGEDGRVSGVEEALKALAKVKPHLVRQAPGGEINATAAGRSTRPSADDVIQRKRAQGGYVPI